MTTPPPPPPFSNQPPGGQPPFSGPPPARPPSGATPGGGLGIPIRPFAVWALLAVAGLLIFLALLSWIFPASPRDFLQRFQVGQFTNLTVLVAPVLAVLIATRAGPVLSHAKVVGMLALIQYASALVLGGVAFLVSIATRFDSLNSGIYAFGGVLQGLGHLVVDLLMLALLALAGLWTYQLFSSMGGQLPRINVQTN